MKLKKLANWLKSMLRQMPRPAVTAALAVLLAAVITVPLLLLSGGKDVPDTPGGTLRGPDVTAADTDNPDTPVADEPFVFTPAQGDFALSVPDGNAGQLYAVPTGSAVLLSTAKALTEEQLTTLSVTPETPITVTASNGGYLIAPTDAGWEQDTLYRLSFEGEDGFLAAFQTRRAFAVESVYPAHEETGVPIDTGIEITFSDTVRSVDLAKYITVTPSFDGRFEIYPNGRTVVIIPDEHLQRQAQYTVTVAAGMPSDNGTTLAEDHVFGFFTMQATSDAFVSELRMSIEREVLSSPGTSPSLFYRLYYSGSRDTVSDTAITAKIYAFDDTAAVRDTLLSALDDRTESIFSSDFSLSPDGLPCVWDGAVEVYRERVRETNETGYLYLPILDEGVYLVALSANAVDSYGMEKEVTAQTLLQVTPLRAYTESVGNAGSPGSDTLVWVHSTETGDAVSGAAIKASAFVNSMWAEPQITELTARTDGNGLAGLVTDEGRTAALIEIEHGGHALLLCTTLAKNTLSDTCRVYLYTDRAVYFENDTVYFHGVLGRAYEGQTLPDTLSLSVAGNDTGVRITVNGDGSFGGSFPIEDWLSSYISFTLTDKDGRVNAYRSLRITEQDKPLYTLNVSYDRPFYTLEHKTAVVTAELSYFDGTPAAGMELQFYVDFPQTEEIIKTDENGVAVFTFSMPEQDWTSTYPAQTGVSVQLTGWETASLYQYAGTYYFHSSGVMTSRRVDRDQSVLTLHALDTSRIGDTAGVYSAYPEQVQGAPMNTQVSVALEKTYYTKTKNGQTSYDPINKVTVEYYDYTPVRETVRTYTSYVVDGEVYFDHIDTQGQECSYTYIVRWYDAASGRTYTERIYANRSVREYNPYNTPYYELTADRNSALVGEDVTLTLYYDGVPAQADGKTVLFTRYNAADMRAEVTAAGGNTFSYTFDEPSAAGSIVYAAVFDGDSYVTQLSHTAIYDYERGSMAEMTVTADRDTYKPGEQATVTVNSPDLAGGTVLVSMVDEACFALGEQSVNLAEYFRFAASRYWGSSSYRLPGVSINSRANLLSMVRDTLTREQSGGLYAVTDDATAEDAAESESVMDQVQVAPAAPATGGASEQSPTYIREVFLDNAAFVTVTLDERGVGTVELDVPDNITTWRLTALGFSGTGMAGGEAVTSGVRCGTAVGAAVCTQPFFLNVTVPDLILSSDAVSVSARTAGVIRAADPMAAVTYHVVLCDETGEEIASYTEVYSTANETAWFSFDTLPVGEYEVTVTGICGIHSDAVRASFRVVDTAQIAMAEKTVTPGEISALTPAAFPMTLTFFDNTDTLYYEVISRLSLGIGSRTDAKAAAYTALMAKEALFGTEGLWYAPGNIADDIRAELSGNYWGFLPLNQYGQGDAILTAEILYCAPGVLSSERKSALVTEYRTLLTQDNATGEQTAAALLALACLDQPVLDLLYRAAQESNSMTDAELLYLSAAFAAIGDTAAARALWEPLRDTWGQEEAGDAFCIVGGDTEETIRLTALALLPASVIDSDTACAMVRYLENHTSSVDLHVLELAAFLTHYTPTAAEETHLSYHLQSGETVDVTLSRGQSHRVTLTAADFRAFTLISADDALCAIAAYGAKPADAGMEEDDILTLSKTITPYRAEDGIYRVTLTFEGTSDADHLQYAITDTIPTGARYFVDDSQKNYANQCAAYLYNRGGQQMRGTISVWNPTLYDKYPMDGTQSYAFSGSISYLIRGAVKGTFSAEPALALNYELGTYAQSEGLTVTIEDGAWMME